MAWDRIRGHTIPRDQLLTAFRRGRFAHAYLFVGPDGVGKRLFAIELAKSLLCEAPPAPLTACDRCPACVQVAAGTHPDFSTARRDEDNDLSIDVMRAFCTALGRKASRGSRKVGIVEEADEFNANSANAFLKVLEEPPAGSVLVLLATTVERQLPTILSRCQIVPFQTLREPDLRAVLADHEVTEPDRVARLVRLAGGSPGRALALNDDSVWQFREVLLSAVSAPKPDATGLIAAWGKFVEEAGKQTPAQRERASLGLGVIIDILRSALRDGLAGDGQLAAVGKRIGAERLADWLEACTEADNQIGRYLQVALVIEALFDRMFRGEPSVR
jgi:DNA polymerase-3 subunit delta'